MGCIHTSFVQAAYYGASAPTLDLLAFRQSPVMRMYARLAPRPSHSPAARLCAEAGHTFASSHFLFSLFSYFCFSFCFCSCFLRPARSITSLQIPAVRDHKKVRLAHCIMACRCSAISLRVAAATTASPHSSIQPGSDDKLSPRMGRGPKSYSPHIS